MGQALSCCRKIWEAAACLLVADAASFFGNGIWPLNSWGGDSANLVIAISIVERDLIISVLTPGEEIRRRKGRAYSQKINPSLFVPAISISIASPELVRRYATKRCHISREFGTHLSSRKGTDSFFYFPSDQIPRIRLKIDKSNSTPMNDRAGADKRQHWHLMAHSSIR